MKQSIFCTLVFLLLVLSPVSAEPVTSDQVLNVPLGVQSSVEYKQKFFNNFAPLLQKAEAARRHKQQDIQAGLVGPSLSGFGLGIGSAQASALDAENLSSPGHQHMSVLGGMIANGTLPQAAPGTLTATGCYTFVNVPVRGQTVAGRLPYSGAYTQVGLDVPPRVCDTGEQAIYDHMRSGQLATPVTANMFAVIMAKQAVLKADLAQDPSRLGPKTRAMEYARTSENANNQGVCCRNNCRTFANLTKQSLINIAAESAATGVAPGAKTKTQAQVIWMVQQMYHHCFVPMAVLLLVPGAILTQIKGSVSYHILGVVDEDSALFSGITRSIVAVFLIPASQLIISYSIDLGNQLMYPVQEAIEQEGGIQLLDRWIKEQAYVSEKTRGYATADICCSDSGKTANTSGKQATQEEQSPYTAKVQELFNTINNAASQGLLYLDCFQFTLMCYLFLLGPIAAAFYAWPSSVGSLFKKSFATWLDGVIVLSLWKFWWCIGILCMVARLKTGDVRSTDQYEMYFFSAWLGILVYVPFHPFEFKPGAYVDRLFNQGKALQGQPSGPKGNPGAVQTPATSAQSCGTQPPEAQDIAQATTRQTASQDSTSIGAGSVSGTADQLAAPCKQIGNSATKEGSTAAGNMTGGMATAAAVPFSAVVPRGIQPPPHTGAKTRNAIMVCLIIATAFLTAPAAKAQSDTRGSGERHVDRLRSGSALYTEQYVSLTGARDLVDRSFGGSIRHSQDGRILSDQVITFSGPTWPLVLPQQVTQPVSDYTAAAVRRNFGIIGGEQNPGNRAILTGTQAAAIAAQSAITEADLLCMPERNDALAREQRNVQTQQNADNQAALARNMSACAIDSIRTFLPNFTVDDNNKWNKLRNELFIPMALLLLLPGAVLAQVKAVVAQGFPIHGEVNPLEGIFRAIIAIFLIPGTYLIVNYGIDLSNSIGMTISSEYKQIFKTDMYKEAVCAEIRANPVRNPGKETDGYIPNQTLIGATAKLPLSGNRSPRSQFEAQHYTVKLEDPCAEAEGAKPSAKGIAGVAIAPPDRTPEKTSAADHLMRESTNTANAMLCTTWNILCAFQVCFLYYLWLVGPIVAALWVYPVKQLRDAFPSWCEGVVTLCFWSLFWNTTVMLMACCRGLDDTGTLMMTALNFLALGCVKYAFGFSELVKAAGEQAATEIGKQAARPGNRNPSQPPVSSAQGTDGSGGNKATSTGQNLSHSASHTSVTGTTAKGANPAAGLHPQTGIATSNTWSATSRKHDNSADDCSTSQYASLPPSTSPASPMCASPTSGAVDQRIGVEIADAANLSKLRVTGTSDIYSAAARTIASTTDATAYNQVSLPPVSNSAASSTSMSCTGAGRLGLAVGQAVGLPPKAVTAASLVGRADNGVMATSAATNSGERSVQAEIDRNASIAAARQSAQLAQHDRAATAAVRGNTGLQSGKRLPVPTASFDTSTKLNSRYATALGHTNLQADLAEITGYDAESDAYSSSSISKISPVSYASPAMDRVVITVSPPPGTSKIERLISLQQQVRRPFRKTR